MIICQSKVNYFLKRDDLLAAFHRIEEKVEERRVGKGQDSQFSDP